MTVEETAAKSICTAANQDSMTNMALHTFLAFFCMEKLRENREEASRADIPRSARA